MKDQNLMIIKSMSFKGKRASNLAEGTGPVFGWELW